MKITIYLLVISFITLSFVTKNPKANFDPGKESYEVYCIGCHMADGKGQPGTNPPLVGSKWVKTDKNMLIKTVLKGLNEPIEVNGVKYKNAMPAHDFIDDYEMSDLLSYVRIKFGEMPDSVTVSEIKAVRESLK